MAKRRPTSASLRLPLIQLPFICHFELSRASDAKPFESVASRILNCVIVRNLTGVVQGSQDNQQETYCWMISSGSLSNAGGSLSVKSPMTMGFFSMEGRRPSSSTATVPICIRATGVVTATHDDDNSAAMSRQHGRDGLERALSLSCRRGGSASGPGFLTCAVNGEWGLALSERQRGGTETNSGDVM